MRFLLAVGVVVGLASLASAAPKSKPKPKPKAEAKPDPKPEQTPEKTRADKLFEDGRRYLANKEYALACTAFEQSQEADPAIGTQLNIALCYEDWGHVASAFRAYVEAERIAKLKFDDRAKLAHTKVVELQQKAPHLHVDLPDTADPSAVFLLDAKEIDRTAFAEDLLLDAGAHTIEARVPSKPPKIVTVDLHDGDHKHVVIDVPKVVVVAQITVGPRKKGRLYGGIAMMAGGAITVGVASIIALGARSDYNTAILMCPGNLCVSGDSYRATQHDRSIANDMTILGGAGLAIAVVGVVLAVTSHGDRVASDHVTAAPLVAPGVVGLAIGGSL